MASNEVRINIKDYLDVNKLITNHNIQRVVDQVIQMKQKAKNEHYKQMKIQPVEALECWLSKEQLTGYHLGTTLVYLARFNAKVPGKGGIDDALKARDHLNWLIEIESEE